jgi:hypothetical protein
VRTIVADRRLGCNVPIVRPIDVRSFRRPDIGA